MNARIVALVSLIGVPLAVEAQTPAAKFVDSARVEIEAAVAASDGSRLSAAIVLLDRALVAFPEDPYLLHYRGYAVYRQVVDAFRSNRIATAGPYIDRAMADLNSSSAKLPWAESWSILAALTGFKLAIDPSQGMTLGPEVAQLQSEADRMGQQNPRVLYLKAVGLYRTPPEYGGGVEPARALIARAIEAFKTDKPGPLAPAWGRDEAVAFQKEIGGSRSQR